MKRNLLDEPAYKTQVKKGNSIEGTKMILKPRNQNLPGITINHGLFGANPALCLAQVRPLKPHLKEWEHANNNDEDKV